MCVWSKTQKKMGREKHQTVQKSTFLIKKIPNYKKKKLKVCINQAAAGRTLPAAKVFWFDECAVWFVSFHLVIWWRKSTSVVFNIVSSH